MKSDYFNLLRLALVLLSLLSAQKVVAQLNVLPEVPITASGSMNVGYAGGVGGESVSNSVYFGTNSTVDGYYVDPRLLKFNIAPNFIWDRNGVTNNPAIRENGEGVTTSVQFLGGGSMPITFSHSYYRTNTATLAGGLNPFTVASTGTSNDMSVGWSYSGNPRIPSVSLNYARGSSTSSIDSINVPDVTNDHSGMTSMANYQVLGFHLFGSYGLTHRNQHTPDALNLGSLAGGKINTSTASAGFSRVLPWSSNIDARWTRNGTDTTQFEKPLHQQYDVITANLTTTPAKPLLLSFSSNYSSNTEAQLYYQLLNGDTIPTYALGVISFGGRSLTYNGGATYNIGHGFFLLGSLGRESDVLMTGDTVDMTVYNGGLMYRRPLLHGIFNGYYTAGGNQVGTHVSGYKSSQRALTQAGTASYSRRTGRWMNQASFRFTANGQNGSGLPVRIISHGYAGDFNTSTKLFYRWSITAGFMVDESSTSPIGQSETFNKSVYGSLSMRNWSITARQQLSSGYALYTAAGITPVYLPGDTATIFSEVHNSGSNGTSIALAFSRRRLSFVTTFSRSNFNMLTPQDTIKTGNENFDSRIYYKVRKLDFRGGYRWWKQSASTNTALNISAHTYYCEVIRQFRLF